MNYIGSKYSLLPFLDECITEIAGERKANETFCDLFAGTGVVGRYFKEKGYKIIANDLQYYSYVLIKHYIANHKVMHFEGLRNEIPTLINFEKEEDRGEIVCNYLNNIQSVYGFVYNNFCKGNRTDNEEYRLYFSNENGAKCDAIRTKIESWYKENKINRNEYYFLLTTLLENIDKVANTASVYGAFLKKLKSSALKPLKMIPAQTIYNGNEHFVYNKDANQLVREIKADILYLDPPYNQRQYSANYHVLETIA